MIISTVLARIDGRRRPKNLIVAAVVLAVVLGLPWMIYPPVAVDIAAWSLFAMALDLLLGFTGLLSFGHAAFWGSSAYVTGIVAIHAGMPFPVAVLAGAIFAAALALPIGWLSVRRSGIYFAMVTLAFAQMIYFIANQWKDVTGGENGLQGIPRELGGLDLSDGFRFYYVAVPIILLGLWAAWRVVHSPFGQVLVAIRENPSRARALGYPIARYKLMIFVISAFLAGLAGGIYATNHGLASLQEVYWTTSGKVVVITILGGIGTLWGSIAGAAIIVQLEDFLATAGIDAIGVVTGGIFVLVVLLFRRGIWGTAAQLIRTRSRAGTESTQPPDTAEAAALEPEVTG